MSIKISLKSARGGEDMRELELALGDDDTIELSIGTGPAIPIYRADLHKALTVLDKWNRIPEMPKES